MSSIVKRFVDYLWEKLVRPPIVVLEYSDGSFTLRNVGKGTAFNVTAESAVILKDSGITLAVPVGKLEFRPELVHLSPLEGPVPACCQFLFWRGGDQFYPSGLTGANCHLPTVLRCLSAVTRKVDGPLSGTVKFSDGYGRLHSTPWEVSSDLIDEIISPRQVFPQFIPRDLTEEEIKGVEESLSGESGPVPNEEGHTSIDPVIHWDAKTGSADD